MNRRICHGSVEGYVIFHSEFSKKYKVLQIYLGTEHIEGPSRIFVTQVFDLKGHLLF
jgi:hypothetical protein